MARYYSVSHQAFRQLGSRSRGVVIVLLLLILQAIVSGCGGEAENEESQIFSLTLPTPAAVQQSNSTAAAVSDLAVQESTATSGSLIVPDTGWQVIRQGLERRVINMAEPGSEANHSLYLLRIDPDHYSFDVGYHPGDPQSLLKWSEETGALITVNGSFFTEENVATGLVVVDGLASGSSYQGFGGMFSIDEAGPHLRWLQQQPYSEAESIKAGLQSFPMLVTPGGSLGYKGKAEAGEKARRTVIAVDKNGRILIVISPSAAFTLAEMSRYLASSDLNLDAALNLDGGASTGLVLNDPAEGIPAFSELPSVILVFAK